MDFSESQANASTIRISNSHEGQVVNGQGATESAIEVDANSSLAISQLEQPYHRESCTGVRFYEISIPPDHYELLLHYPTRLHQNSLPSGVRAPSWSFDSHGNFYSKECMKLFEPAISQMPPSRTCESCLKLHYCPYLHGGTIAHVSHLLISDNGEIFNYLKM